MTPAHLPVMADEVTRALAPADGEVYVDGTFGRGGYASAWLEAADCIVYGIDRDPEAVAFGAELAARYPGRLTVLRGRFADMESLLADKGVAAVDGVALDLGVSSPQLETAARGFSFALDGPLDMRMEEEGPTAADVVNGESEAALADILYQYGEERRSRAIAKAIVAARVEAPFERTGQLAELIARVVRRGAKRAQGRDRGRDGARAIHPATRSFQALRIYVNEELDQLARGLAAAERLLAPAGRLVVVAFHSLEDRAVKNFLRARAGETPRASRHRPETASAAPTPSFRLLFRGACKPGAAEAAGNPRARSARLRAAVRTDAPAWPAEAAA